MSTQLGLVRLVVFCSRMPGPPGQVTLALPPEAVMLVIDGMGVFPLAVTRTLSTTQNP